MRAAALLLAACASTATTPPPPAIRVPLRPAYIPFVDEPRFHPAPAIDLATVTPDTDRSRPWPLTELPSLQPHHDFAMARDLCTGEWAARNQQHADLVAYGAAWCRIQAGDHEALAVLAGLARKSRSDIERAARLDLINLVARRDAATAVGQLTRLRMGTAADLDLLAATYGALDMRAEAVVVADRARRIDREPTYVARCERTLAWAVLDDDTRKTRLEDLAGGPGSCGKRAAAVTCAIDAAQNPVGQLAGARECFNEFPNDADAERRAWLLTAYFRWPVHATADWLALSRDAENALGLDGAEELAVTALDNAVLASSCEAELLREVAAAAYRIANHDQHVGKLEPRLDALRAMTEKRCIALHE